MRIRGAGRLRRAAVQIKKRLSRQALILLYHRVTELSSDPWLLSVTPEHFAEHLEVLGKYGRLMPVQQLAAALQKNNLPRRAVLVTFDDGYADNLVNAKPLLERYDVPATVFVATGYIGSEREFWWDELEGLFLQPGTLPQTLRLSVNGSVYKWELGEAAHYSEADYRLHHGWIPREKDDPGSRQVLYRSLYELMHPLSEAERRRARDELRAWSGAERLARSTHRSLSPEEVIALAQGGLVEVGSHTVTHPQLSALPPASQQDEIRHSKARLEEILGRTVTSFAYPYGRRCDYTDETAAIVRESGFACACSNFTGVVGRRTDRFHLPRIQAQDVDGETFARQLGEWFQD